MSIDEPEDVSENPLEIARKKAEIAAAAASDSEKAAIASAAKAEISATSAADSQESAKESLKAAVADAAKVETAKNNAETSAAEARSSAKEADGVATAAGDSSKAAAQSELAAKTSADTAATGATNAKNSAVQAALDATKAETDAETAEGAAKKAADSSEEAAASAVSAGKSAGEAETELTNAKTSALASAKSASDAKAHKDQVANDVASVQKKLAEVSEHIVFAEGEAEKAARAHNLSTTAGLAGAFNNKALWAIWGQCGWGVVTGGALIWAGSVGWHKFDTVTGIIQELLKRDGYNANQILSAVLIQVVLSLLSLAAPVWLAWLSARMVSKYFHLSQDYAYKAALAQAYVGFRNEAENLDPVFQERLFAAAITQLDANPVRLLDHSSNSHPGSPLQDLMQQDFMRAALQDITFRNLLGVWLRKTFNANFPLPEIVVKTLTSATPAEEAPEVEVNINPSPKPKA